MQATRVVRAAQQHIAAGVGRITTHVFDRGQGSWVWTKEGQKFLDFTTGIGVTSTGHCHPKVVAAAQAQTAKIIHAQVNIGYSTPMLELIDELLPIMPKGLDSFFFANSGAEAVENALKLARQATGKQNVIVFQGSFHGRTIGTMSLTTSKTVYRNRFGPLMPGVFVSPFPYCLHCPANGCATGGGDKKKQAAGSCDVSSSSCSTGNSGSGSGSVCCKEAMAQLRLLVKQQTAPEETCAVLIEPVLGEGGYVPCPPGFLAEVRKFCDEHKMLLICDEIQSGFGRTGKLFACDGHYGVVPDILVMAKGIASGFPLSAIATRTELSSKQAPGSMGGTYTGNAVACAAAVATQRVLKEEKLIENSHVRGEQLMAGLHKLRAEGKYPIRDIRGRGLMVGLEFDARCKYGTALAVTQACQRHGMLLLTTSVYETLRFIPPLTVSAEEVDLGLQIFKKALDEVFAASKP